MECTAPKSGSHVTEALISHQNRSFFFCLAFNQNPLAIGTDVGQCSSQCRWQLSASHQKIERLTEQQANRTPGP